MVGFRNPAEHNRPAEGAAPGCRVAVHPSINESPFVCWSEQCLHAWNRVQREVIAMENSAVFSTNSQGCPVHVLYFVLYCIFVLFIIHSWQNAAIYK